MFGHQDDTQQPQNNGWGAQPPVDPGIQPAAPMPAPADPGYLAGTPATQAPVNDQPLLEEQANDGFTTPIAPPVDAPAPVSDAAAPAAPVNDALLGIKQQALQQLSPLVGQLDQPPEEKFRTTMMMIQASDNQDLISVAYEAANQISDEKARAQALLDIVNEINYFTQAH